MPPENPYSNSTKRQKAGRIGVILTLGIIAVAIAVCFRPQTSESAIRLTGLALQLLGIGTVAWGISETRALFGRPSFVSKVTSLFARFLLRRKTKVFAIGGAAHAKATARGRAYLTQGAGPNPSIEARVEALEKNIKNIHDRISDTEHEMSDEVRRVRDRFREEQAVREAEDLAIRKLLEATGTGGIHISAIGAFLLFFGVILSTAASEIAYWLR